LRFLKASSTASRFSVAQDDLKGGDFCVGAQHEEAVEAGIGLDSSGRADRRARQGSPAGSATSSRNGPSGWPRQQNRWLPGRRLPSASPGRGIASRRRLTARHRKLEWQRIIDDLTDLSEIQVEQDGRRALLRPAIDPICRAIDLTLPPVFQERPPAS
jgi:hypothetical protein